MPTTTLETDRLLLRRFRRSDVQAVHAILGDPRVVATLLDISHPFTRADAATWIQLQKAAWTLGERFSFALVLKANNRLIGAVDVEIQAEHNRGELAYWLEVDCWGHGLAAEASAQLLRYGFDKLGLHRLYAQCLCTNRASARVMEKIGLLYEATFRQHCRKDGAFVDMLVYGLTREDAKAACN